MSHQLPSASEHSYLPGRAYTFTASKPLLSNSNGQLKLDLLLRLPPSMIVFPGAVVPIRLPYHRETANKIKQLIDSENNNNSNNISIGFLPDAAEINNSSTYSYEYHERIGTVGTLIKANLPHDDDDTQQNNNLFPELILTVECTHRFRANPSILIEEVQLYNTSVQLIEEDEPVYPQFPTTTTTTYNTNDITAHNNKRIDFLAAQSHLPKWVYESHWPWYYSRKILVVLGLVEKYEGLKHSFPEFVRAASDQVFTNTHHEVLHNQLSKFTFWLANYLPLSLEEKLELLHQHNILLRLKLIYNLIAPETKQSQRRSILCGTCREEIADLDHVFTVPGATGVSGNYVNSYGHVHQTLTLKNVLSRKIFCMGGAHAQDSWFPGYAWTSAFCLECRCHLGWLFSKLQQEEDDDDHDLEDDDEGNPVFFWGLSESSVTLGREHSHRQRQSSTTTDRNRIILD